MLGLKAGLLPNTLGGMVTLYCTPPEVTMSQLAGQLFARSWAPEQLAAFAGWARSPVDKTMAMPARAAEHE
jgi:hypothetical protein